MRVINLVLILLALCGLAQADITTGLVAHWRFDEAVGTTSFDNSGNGHVATLAASTATPAWLASGCHQNSCLSFDGTNDDMSIASITTGTTFTWAAWVFPVTPVTAFNVSALAATDATSVGFYLYQAVGTPLLLTWIFSSAGHDSTTALTANAWNHVAVVSTAGAFTFYLNGATNGTGTAGPSFAWTRMGNTSLGDPLKGRMDDVWFFSRALTTPDINELLNQSDRRNARHWLD